MKAAVLGTSGYTGQLLIRILLEHPQVTEIIPVSMSKEGEKLVTVDPGLNPHRLEKIAATAGVCISVAEAKKKKPDVVFAALPHLKSGDVCAEFFGTSVIIDLSADFRFRDAAIFAQAYGAPVPRPDLLPRAVYGLAEWNTDAIKKTDLIANPGCYTTAGLLPLLPLVKEGMIRGKAIINAISGVSGAGKKLESNYLFCERSENAGAYTPGTTHRHCAEIQAEIDFAAQGVSVIFNPHLAPLTRGIAATITLTLAKPLDRAAILSIYEKYYGGRPFVSLREKGIPQTGDVWGSNRCDIGLHAEGDTLILFSVIDNLIKGASGQAVQNMNIRFGIAETSGLRVHGDF
jgi:N-acetyl-gamma-glutamyl-phosphate reductase